MGVLVERVPVDTSPGITRPECETVSLPSCNIGVKMSGSTFI